MTKGKWLTIALVISLGINLLLAGFVIGTKFRSPPSGMMMNPMFGLMRYAEGLPTQRREELLKEMRGFHPKGRTEFRMMRELQANVRAEIRREPLDPVADRDWVAALPKVDLHCHLGGFATEGETLLAVRKAAEEPQSLPAPLELPVIHNWPVPDSPISLQDYMKRGDANGRPAGHDGTSGMRQRPRRAAKATRRACCSTGPPSSPKSPCGWKLKI